MDEKVIFNYEMYLYMSYLPRCSEAHLDWLNCDFDYDFGIGIDSEKWWIREGAKALKRAMADQIASTDPNALHIVLLSGGLDSRAILGGLLENVSHSQIVAATYGIPGALDFETAKLITRKFGIRHEVFDLMNEEWNIDHLVKAASRLKDPVSVHQSYVRQKINHHFGVDCVYWSGFLGGSLTGAHFQKEPSTNRLEAIKRLVNLAPTPHYKDAGFQSKIIDKICAETPWDKLNQTKYSLDQQIYLCLRQRFLTQPIVIVNGFHFMAPFIDKTWVNFMANVPPKWLQGQYLYRKIIEQSYPELSRLPSRTMAGMPINASKYKTFVGKAIAKVKPYIIRRDPYCSPLSTNYVNWTEALRHNGYLQESVCTTLQDLRKRQIFETKDLDRWWSDHLHKKIDHTRLLMNLSSLELLLKAKVI